MSAVFQIIIRQQLMIVLLWSFTNQHCIYYVQECITYIDGQDFVLVRELFLTKIFIT